jgi:hypothetical protein
MEETPGLRTFGGTRPIRDARLNEHASTSGRQDA